MHGKFFSSAKNSFWAIPALVVLTSAPVQAFSLTDSSVTGITAADTNQSFTINFNGNVNSTNIVGLSSTAVFTFLGFSANGSDTNAVFNILLTNTSTSGITSRTSALGFDTNPNVSAASSTGLFNNAFVGANLPNGFGSIETCFNNGGNACQGGGSGGVSTGQPSGLFTTTLTFLGTVNTIDLSNFGVRYQSISGTSLGNSGTGVGTPVPPNPVPAPPVAVGLWGIAALAAGAKAKKLLPARKP
ncbi:cistern family PEP-CTERM protein [Anthocerotibacter panamensis]|uniref:cistern family PEP-CTERM protein n=1 Tax=Anthocerotibacter panamensis TaxID=2857077 RepID=UPI001C40188F|nr:cistern family PEP-CTERM protein [Anthocerotibacter panamensis]